MLRGLNPFNAMFTRRRAPRRSANAYRRYKKLVGYDNSFGMNIKYSWYSLRKKAMKRCNSCCEVCGSPASEVHHIVPLSKGGINQLSNLICLCKNCHNARHNHLRGRK